jgi:hypothetical protein
MGVHLSSRHLPWRHSAKCASLRVSLALLAVTLGLGTAAGVAPSGAVPSRPGPIAVAARTLSLNLTASMHLVGRPGHVLTHQGALSGTLSGQMYARSVSLSSNRGTATFTFYLKGGTLSGQATISGHVVGAAVPFTGTAKITGGTGSWAHTSGGNLRYSGVMNRQNFHIAEHISGTVRR